MKNRFKLSKSLLLALICICLMSVNVFAADEFDMVASVTSSLDGMVTQVMAIIGLAVAAVMGIVGTKMAITKGISVLKSLVSKG